jgi:dienelactone hydrolase
VVARATLCAIAVALLAGCGKPAVEGNGLYRFPDGRLVAVGNATDKGLTATEYASGAAMRLRPRGRDRFDVVPWGAKGWEDVAVLDRSEGAITALTLGEQRGENVPLTEVPMDFTADDGVRLHARLILPEGRGPHPTVVYVHGSGRQSATRTFGFGYFLAAEGIATLIYDKRGTGDSRGRFTMDFDQLADDVVVAVWALRARPEVDTTRIGLIGYSQGGWVAPLAANRTPVAFVVVNYGMVESPGDEERRETLWRLRERGFSDAELAAADTLIHASLPLLASNFEDGWDRWNRVARAMNGRPWTRRLGGTTIGAILKYPNWVVRMLGPRVAPPGMPWDYDGRTVIAGSTTPTVWLLGAEDRSAPNAVTIAFLDSLQREGRKQAVIVFPGADHGIVRFRRTGDQRVPTGYHPDYLRTKVRVVHELAAGRWPPQGIATAALP